MTAKFPSLSTFLFFSLLCVEDKRGVANFLIVLLIVVSPLFGYSQKIEWISSTEKESWISQNLKMSVATSDSVDLSVDLNRVHQTIEGFGTCFNELGWTSLAMLSESERKEIMKELFQPGKGANFTVCRMPVGANDFSRGWYSYNEAEGDFNMEKFSISNDDQTLVPFIKSALQYNPKLKVWASPWSPPTWMKHNKHYASVPFPTEGTLVLDDMGFDFRGRDNGLKPGQEGKEGTNMFIVEDSYLEAYALYFEKFIKEYKSRGIVISMVMPQNEFNSAQYFPSCTWTPSGLRQFIEHLSPRMEALNVDIYFGTLERANIKLADTVLANPRTSKHIKGVGLQWGGKGAVKEIHETYPALSLYQTEQECGNGKNDWKHCEHTWSLFKHYLSNGTNAYLYWNTALVRGGISTWGWKQNSLISVDSLKKTFTYNPEYYLMKHFSHYVKPGASRVATQGTFSEVLAFKNPDNSIVIVAHNSEAYAKELKVKVGNKVINPSLKPHSFNTFYISKK